MVVVTEAVKDVLAVMLGVTDVELEAEGVKEVEEVTDEVDDMDDVMDVDDVCERDCVAEGVRLGESDAEGGGDGDANVMTVGR